MLYPSCTGLSFIRRVCTHFYFMLIRLILMHSHYSFGILLGMCLSILFKNVRGLFLFVDSILLEFVE